MFPALHGVVSQALGAGGGGPFTATWASTTTPAGGPVSIGTAGWAFTVSRPLTATKARVYSTSTSFTIRGVRIWRSSDGANLGETHFAWQPAGLGWQEEPFVSPIALEPGETYVIVTWRSNSATNRVGTHDATGTPWQTIPEVTFIEGRESTTQNGVLATTATDTIRGVDFWAEAA